MALRLFAPGERKGNRYWLARGSIAGRVHEFSTGVADEKTARRIAREYEARVKAKPDPDRVTFAEAARRYVEFRNPRAIDRRRLDRIIGFEAIGRTPIRAIRPGALHDLAIRLYPRGVSATRNREVLRPAAAVLHHAADAGLCDWIRIRSFKEPRPRTRAIDPAAAALLIGAARLDTQRLLLTWLFFQGTRIGDTLRVQWSDIDLERRIVRVHVSKTDQYEEFPLHERTLAELRCVQEQTGPLFPWTHTSTVRRWLAPICAETGIYFTPHMARHTLGTMMAANGASLRAIMAALGHRSAAASLRYQAADVEMVRAETAKVVLPQAKKLGSVA